MKLFHLCLLFTFICVSMYAQDIEYYTPESDAPEVYEDTQSNTFDTQSNTQGFEEFEQPTVQTQDYELEQLGSGVYEDDNAFFKWAWEKAHYGYDYAIARQGGWTDPSSGGNAVIAFFATRDEIDGDSRAISGYASFRPFLFDYGTHSFAVGISYFGTLQKFYQPTNVDAINILGADFDVVTQDIDVALNYQSFNLSVLGSFPEIGVQVTFEIGYLLSNLRADIKDINVNNDIVGLELRQQNYRFKQRDHNLFVSLEARKLFERDYLNIFSLYLYANVNLNSERRTSRSDVSTDIGGVQDDFGRVENLEAGVAALGGLVQTGNIDPEDETLDTSYIGAFFTSRLINIPFGYEFIGEQSGLALETIAGIEYGYGEFLGADVHGAALQAGAQLSFFEFAILSFTHTWHQSNDFNDEWNISLAIGLYGAVSPNESNRVAPSIRGF